MVIRWFSCRKRSTLTITNGPKGIWFPLACERDVSSLMCWKNACVRDEEMHHIICQSLVKIVDHSLGMMYLMVYLFEHYHWVVSHHL